MCGWAQENARPATDGGDRVECPLCFSVGTLNGYMLGHGLDWHIRNRCRVFREIDAEIRAGEERRSIAAMVRKAHTPPPVFVYLIRATETGRVKIGRSTSPERRLQALQGASSAALELLARLREQGETTEDVFHRRFSAHRLAGEWFRPAPEIFAAFKVKVPA